MNPKDENLDRIGISVGPRIASGSEQLSQPCEFGVIPTPISTPVYPGFTLAELRYSLVFCAELRVSHSMFQPGPYKVSNSRNRFQLPYTPTTSESIV